MNQPEVVVITGTTSGIGLATARRFLQTGHQVICACRDPGRMVDLVSPSHHTPMVVALDLKSQPSIEAAAAKIIELVGSRSVALINNAGIAIPAPLECTSFPTTMEMFQVNCLGLFHLTHLLLSMLRSNGGRVINIGSVSGEVAFPGLGIYAATKHALRAYTDSLRMEMHGTGIAVSLVEPGNVATAVWDKCVDLGTANAALINIKVKQDYFHFYSGLRRIVEKQSGKACIPMQVAQVIERAACSSNPACRYLVGSDAKIACLLSSILPKALFDRLRIAAVEWKTPSRQ